MLHLILRTYPTIALLALAAMPTRPVEAAGAYMRGPMIGHVSPESAVIWIYTKNRPGVRVYYREAGADKSTARFVDMDVSRTGVQRARVTLTGLKPDTNYVYRAFFRRKRRISRTRSPLSRSPPWARCEYAVHTARRRAASSR